MFDGLGLSEAQTRFCDLVADGVTIKDTCVRMHWTEKQYRYQRVQMPAFKSAVTAAYELAQDAHVDSIPEIIDNEPDVTRMREKVAAIKWTASKRNARYSDRLDVNIATPIGIGAAMLEARARHDMRLRCDSAEVIDVQVIDNVNESCTLPIAIQSTIPDIFT